MLMLVRPVPETPRGSDAIRRRALERLYMRKAAVDNLIQSLENYARTQGVSVAPCVAINEAPKWSLDSAR
jgi:hypothetical protein